MNNDDILLDDMIEISEQRYLKKCHDFYLAEIQSYLWNSGTSIDCLIYNLNKFTNNQIKFEFDNNRKTFTGNGILYDVDRTITINLVYNEK